MKVKERIFQSVYDYCKLHSEGITASELANKLEMRRNLVSQYLNELVRENKIEKSMSRPVFFKITQNKEDNKNITNSQTEIPEIKEDVFSSFIGAYGSMQDKIEQCRSAVTYPNKGLPILLNGKSGVGKSFLAELIYKYAKEIQVIDQNAPFIVLNCADYANNPELLTSILFGYEKGAFTGADVSKEGLVAQADGGYLFLDEVHRLNSESQEKLFLLMDKDEYRKIGETKTTHHARIRMIFATTEEPSKVLIHTLRRRIPMMVHIPSLSERPMKEKLELIRQFFLNESKILNKKICVSVQAINLLLSLKAEGNVGSLQSVIKYSCAKVYRTSENEDVVHVDFYDFPKEIRVMQKEQKEYVKDEMLIDFSSTEKEKIFYQEYDIQHILELFEQQYKEKKVMSNVMSLQKAIYQVYDNLHLREYSGITRQLVQVVIDEFEHTQGITLPMNTSEIFGGIIDSCQNVNYEQGVQKRFKEALQFLEHDLFKSFSLAEKLISRLEATLGVTLSLQVVFYITVFLSLANHNTKAAKYNALIMAHGSTTASSIASVANEMLGEYIFESFNLPIDTSFEMFSDVLNRYLNRINKSDPTVILVDMGSLTQIDYHMQIEEYQEIGILDNVSTQVALEVGNRLQHGDAISSILEDVSENVKLHYRYIQPRVRKKAVVCVCISGIGTAEKLKEIVKDFVLEDYELLTYDYMKILKEGKNCSIFQEYDVQCLIGTSDLKVEGVDCVNINHLMDNEDETDIQIFMEKVICKNDQANLEIVQQKIIKSFSIESLLNRMVFLNPTMIIDDVEHIIFDTELSLNIMFDTDTRMMLFLHIAVLIERVLLKNCDEEIYQSEEWIEANKKRLNLIDKAFYNIKKKFNIVIPLSEIVTILLMIDMKSQN